MATGRWTVLAAVLALGLGSSLAQAATCTVNDPLTNPDASVTHATACGAGIGTQTADTDLEAAVPGIQDFTEVDKDEDASTLGDDDNGFLLLGALTGGTWYIDTDIAGTGDFYMVLKDGNIPDATYDWYWFNIDETQNQGDCTNGGALTGYELCGTWTMYGVGGNLRELSHGSLFVTEGGPPPGETPEPGVLSLLGLGLLALAFRRRRVGS